MVTPLMKMIGSIRRAMQFIPDRRGVAAVEFAGVLPFLVLLAIGTVELADGVTAKNKLTHVTSSLGDLVAQSKVITNTDMTNILNASAVIIEPFPKNKLKVVVSGVTIDADANPKVTWSDARGTDPLPIGSAYELPANLKVPNTFLIVSEGSFGYTPVVAHVLSGEIDLKDRFYLVPRLTAKVCRPPQTAQNC